jgi:hypothetical protein
MRYSRVDNKKKYAPLKELLLLLRANISLNILFTLVKEIPMNSNGISKNE